MDAACTPLTVPGSPLLTLKLELIELFNQNCSLVCNLSNV